MMWWRAILDSRLVCFSACQVICLPSAAECGRAFSASAVGSPARFVSGQTGCYLFVHAYFLYVCARIQLSSVEVSRYVDRRFARGRSLLLHRSHLCTPASAPFLSVSAREDLDVIRTTRPAAAPRSHLGRLLRQPRKLRRAGRAQRRSQPVTAAPCGRLGQNE